MESFQKKYMRRAKLMALLLSSAPFIRMIALNGSLARAEAKKSSDIDFFIVTKKGRLWSGRFLVTALTHLTGLRRHHNLISGRICLNYYQTEDHLAVNPPRNRKNAWDFANTIVLWRRGLVEKKFFDENEWIEQYGFEFKNMSYRPGILSVLIAPLAGLIRTFLEIIFEILGNNPLEEKLRSYQIKKILSNPVTGKASSRQIYISDQELRFHPPKN